ncbi:Na+/H+ antiporter NhaD/arsenite permease-like protein [Paenibacillus sp. V4I3]|uniref:SLC13 family permease n=1 Tax=unclassified Paenibacillus TaxID=185978 RepID=UPI0027828EC6|nr:MULTISPECIES: SLC13 family permease [unclassified Paenibacillus]MDQ0877985.1 Na+/H+ antiporter NhaD/arsenite permease-like protein [Paenibacillus sp. V4I3]MDQ0886189.1 Na+/H+ antiporter NhaD/arsenite permease-like protein [Paenibacillus sp. V4I9]
MTEFSQGPALWQAIVALIIFAAAYVCILIEKWDRIYTALGGALLMIIMGIVPLGKAVTSYANWHVLLLITSLFVISGVFQKTGIIAYSAAHILRKFRIQPITILLSLSVLAAIVSALLDGLLAIAVLVPILLKTTKMMKLSPVPFLISILLSVNIGGAATLMGNLPNRMIGVAENISIGEMLIKLGPLVIILLVIVYLVIWLIYGKKMIVAESYKRELLTLQPASYLASDRGFLTGSCLITGLTLLALLLQGVLGWKASYIAVCGAVTLLAINYKELVQLVKRRDYLSVWQGVRETQLLFFFGLFIMTGGLTYAGISGFIAVKGLEISQGNIPFLSILLLWLTGFGSAMMDYIPYTAAMIPVVEHMGSTLQNTAGISTVSTLWWSLIVGTAIGSGVTLLSSMTSMYAAGLSDQEGGGLTQRGYIIVAAPISLLLFIAATIYFKLFL